jgi:hypothetical protein
LNTRVTVTGNFSYRYLHSSVIYEDFLFVFGGHSQAKPTDSKTEENKTNMPIISDLNCFHFATRTWTSIENESICLLPRMDHSSVVYGDSMFIFGGSTVSSNSPTLMDDLLEFKFDTQSWNTLSNDGSRPSKRRGHAAIVYENSMFVVGGLSAPNNPSGSAADEKSVMDIYEYNFGKFYFIFISIFIF